MYDHHAPNNLESSSFASSSGTRSFFWKPNCLTGNSKVTTLCLRYHSFGYNLLYYKNQQKPKSGTTKQQWTWSCPPINAVNQFHKTHQTLTSNPLRRISSTTLRTCIVRILIHALLAYSQKPIDPVMAPNRTPYMGFQDVTKHKVRYCCGAS
jgi:hypothetical protein